jgi:hypothetical protein
MEVLHLMYVDINSYKLVHGSFTSDVDINSYQLVHGSFTSDVDINSYQLVHGSFTLAAGTLRKKQDHTMLNVQWLRYVPPAAPSRKVLTGALHDAVHTLPRRSLL